jgi:site-specific DNA-methyltransferase (adenine-specific)
VTEPYYADESVTLYHGDALQISEWLSSDVLVTDPPYGYGYASGRDGAHKGRTIAGDESVEARDTVLATWGRKPALVFGTWKCPVPDGTRTVLAWDKGLAAGMGDLSLSWKPNWEMIYVLGHGFCGNRDSGVITGSVVSWASRGRDHPNQKPVGLLAKLLHKCPPGTVADPFAGSGSTLVAAKMLGRRAVGVEIDERYCETAAKRLAQDAFDLIMERG